MMHEDTRLRLDDTADNDNNTSGIQGVVLNEEGDVAGWIEKRGKVFNLMFFDGTDLRRFELNPREATAVAPEGDAENIRENLEAHWYEDHLSTIMSMVKQYNPLDAIRSFLDDD